MLLTLSKLTRKDSILTLTIKVRRNKWKLMKRKFKIRCLKRSMKIFLLRDIFKDSRISQKILNFMKN
jgi:hypothetical protein